MGGGEEIALGVAQGLGFVPGKNGGLQFGKEGTEEGGAEEDAGDHFSDDLGLAEACSDCADDPAEEEDDGELKEEMDGEMEIIHLATLER